VKGTSEGKEEAKEENIMGGKQLGYTQTYCIQKLNSDVAASRQVLFRFGEWVYAGRAELGSDIGLSELPELISMLRLQQHNLQFECESAKMPGTPLQYYPSTALSSRLLHLQRTPLSHPHSSG
jgi:hypothetical protein